MPFFNAPPPPIQSQYNVRSLQMGFGGSGQRAIQSATPRMPSLSPAMGRALLVSQGAWHPLAQGGAPAPAPPPEVLHRGAVPPGAPGVPAPVPFADLPPAVQAVQNALLQGMQSQAAQAGPGPADGGGGGGGGGGSLPDMSSGPSGGGGPPPDASGPPDMAAPPTIPMAMIPTSGIPAFANKTQARAWFIAYYRGQQGGVTAGRMDLVGRYEGSYQRARDLNFRRGW